MKKIFYLAIVAMFMANFVKAAPGDTTWVQGQTDAWLGIVPTNTDSTLLFPDGSKSYRKIYMIFTLGKYACPGSPQYCSDWDYTVQNFLLTPNGDTVELGRLITPYANSARMNATWKGRYIFDVTDMYPLLKSNATVRIHYSGWSGGFTGTIQFAFIEGTPPRNVLGIERLWHGGFTYGDGANPIDNKVTAISKTAPAGAVSTEMKLNITGHGGDATANCAEFCKKYYQVKVNGSMTEQKDIWRDDCGRNDLYPQNGTWVFDRGNWCPGDLVYTNVHNLNVAGGSAYDVDIDFESYTGTTDLGSYIVEGAVYYYGGFNKQLDASLEDIIAPSDYEFHFRANPATPQPVIKVKNTGGTTITSLEIEYGIVGKTMASYTWQGSLASLQETEITLPELMDLRVATGNASFSCNVTKVNGQSDDDNTNNSIISNFTAAPQWPTKIIITLITNGSATGGGTSETSWKIYHNGNLVTERINNGLKTTVIDTVVLGPGAYRLDVEDVGCDGIRWWLYQFYPVNPGNGTFLVRRADNLNTLQLKGYYNGDFGCGFSQQFNVNWPTGITDVYANGTVNMSVYPNPAGNQVTVLLDDGQTEIHGRIHIVDAIGRTVLQQKISAHQAELNTSTLANGLYSVMYLDDKGKTRLQNKLIISR